MVLLFSWESLNSSAGSHAIRRKGTSSLCRFLVRTTRKVQVQPAAKTFLQKGQLKGRPVSEMLFIFSWEDLPTDEIAD